MNFLPSPVELGAPEPFHSWREGQEEALAEALATDKRFVALSLPTGAGKTLIYMIMALMEEGRTAVVTSTKALQQQLQGDFNFLRDIRGKNNYPCLELGEGGEHYDPRAPRMDRNCDAGPCLDDFQCVHRDKGCSYFDAYRSALKSKIPLTNYSYWMSSYYYSEGLGEFDQLVLDEAHKADGELAGFFHTELAPTDLALTRFTRPTTLDPLEWRKWAKNGIEAIPKKGVPAIEKFKTKLSRVKGMDSSWVVDEQDGMFTFDPRTPRKLASHLFAGIDKVILVSATVRPKTCDLLGIDSDDLLFYEADSLFPASNRKLVHIPTIRVNYKTTPSELRVWVARIDQIVDRRKDRKGILHTVSYKRARFFAEHSRHKDILITHGSRDTAQKIKKFKKASAPRLLVSPATTTGYDFPGDQVRYQILGKIAFPDNRSKIMQARCEDDKELTNYLAMQELVQSCGRGVRSEDDWCENFIVDDNWVWFKNAAKKFAPSWFIRACGSARTVPNAREL